MPEEGWGILEQGLEGPCALCHPHPGGHSRTTSPMRRAPDFSSSASTLASKVSAATRKKNSRTFSPDTGRWVLRGSARPEFIGHRGRRRKARQGRQKCHSRRPEGSDSPVRDETAQYSAFISWAILSASFSISTYWAGVWRKARVRSILNSRIECSWENKRRGRAETGPVRGSNPQRVIQGPVLVSQLFGTGSQWEHYRNSE